VCLRPGAAGLPELPAGARKSENPDGLVIDLPADADVDAFLRAVLAAGARVHSLTPRRESLEDLFVREATSHNQGAA
jgi:hypothetical protein